LRAGHRLAPGFNKGAMPKGFFQNAYRKITRDELEPAPTIRGKDGQLVEAHPNKHSMPKDVQLDILNNWDQMWTGMSENGRPVDIYYKDGRVVVTQQGNKNQIVTAYGEGYGGRVDPSRWSRENWKKGEVYASFRRNKQR